MSLKRIILAGAALLTVGGCVYDPYPGYYRNGYSYGSAPPPTAYPAGAPVNAPAYCTQPPGNYPPPPPGYCYTPLPR